MGASAFAGERAFSGTARARIHAMNDRLENGRIVHIAGISPEMAYCAIRLHRRTLDGELVGIVLKKAAKTNVTLVTAVDGDLSELVCVKEFVRPAALRLLPAGIRHLPAIRSWRAGRELLARGIASPEPLALIFGPDRSSSCLVMRRAAGEDHLRLYVQRRFPRERNVAARRAFAADCAEFLCNGWERGVFHQDMKATNLHVRESAPGEWEFELIDAAAVVFRKRLTVQEMILNLVQLNSSTPRVITRADRLRFMERVVRRRPELAGREVTREIARLSLERGGIWLQ